MRRRIGYKEKYKRLMIRYLRLQSRYYRLKAQQLAEIPPPPREQKAVSRKRYLELLAKFKRCRAEKFQRTYNESQDTT